ncbi:uncharacterized protein LOC144921572 isoform X2 [Branchiostoma floridae x Branchiostoma belcheri]
MSRIFAVSGINSEARLYRIIMDCTTCMAEQCPRPKDHIVEKMRYEPEGALTDEDRRSTHLQPDTQESEELLPHGAQCAHEGTCPSDDRIRHSPTSDTQLHKPAVAEHGELLQQHRDAENNRQ